MTEHTETTKAPYRPDGMTKLIIYMTDICEVLEQEKFKHEKYYRDAMEYLDHVKRASRDLDVVRTAERKWGDDAHRHVYDGLRKSQRDASENLTCDDDVTF